jgi:hypothetical protein
VWWFAGTENVAQTLVPRLAAAGALLEFVKVLEGTSHNEGRPRPLRFPEDLAVLRGYRTWAPKLIVIDPLVSFCGTGTGTLHEARTRKVLMELARFAAETNAAIVVVRHLNRRIGAGAIERGSAGPSLLAEARSGLLLTMHPDDPHRRVLSSTKCNLGPTPPSLEIAIRSRNAEVKGSRNAEVGSRNSHPPAASDPDRHNPPAEERGNAQTTRPLSSIPQSDFRIPTSLDRNPPSWAAVIRWLGVVPFTADELVRQRKVTAGPTRKELRQAEKWVRAKLAQGPQNADELAAEAKQQDLPAALLQRVRTTLGVLVAGTNGHTTWRLPGEEPCDRTARSLPVDQRQRPCVEHGDTKRASDGRERAE